MMLSFFAYPEIRRGHGAVCDLIGVPNNTTGFQDGSQLCQLNDLLRVTLGRSACVEWSNSRRVLSRATVRRNGAV